jgi:hypothetical protein
VPTFIDWHVLPVVRPGGKLECLTQLQFNPLPASCVGWAAIAAPVLGPQIDVGHQWAAVFFADYPAFLVHRATLRNFAENDHRAGIVVGRSTVTVLSTQLSISAATAASPKSDSSSSPRLEDSTRLP